jgi:hypothetical protein
MLELLRENPWVIIVSLALLIPILGVVCGTTTNYLLRVRQVEFEAGLKQEMVQRGMSAEEIRIVIEATSRRRGKHCSADAADHQEVS